MWRVRSTFRPDPVDPATFVRAAIVVPDANVLLGLYRLSTGAREEALQALESIGDRLWLPHQVGHEFYENLAATRGALAAAYADALKAVEGLSKVPAAAFQSGKRFEESREAVGKVLTDGAAKMRKEIEALLAEDASIVAADDDAVLERIEAMFDGRVGDSPSAATLLARVAEFVEHRVPAQMPPGYEDGTRKSTAPMRGAGDYLWWCEVLSMAASDDRPVLVVTDDVKGDWWVRNNGKTVGPRPELVREFAEHSSAGYHQMTFSSFVQAATAPQPKSVSRAVQEIEAIASEAAARGYVTGGDAAAKFRMLTGQDYPASAISSAALARQHFLDGIAGSGITDLRDTVFPMTVADRYGLGTAPWAMSAAERLGTSPTYDALSQLAAHFGEQDRAWLATGGALTSRASHYDSINRMVEEALKVSGPLPVGIGLEAAAEVLAASTAGSDVHAALEVDQERDDTEIDSGSQESNS
jgi:predicted nucleic acid-binding protein